MLSLRFLAAGLLFLRLLLGAWPASAQNPAPIRLIETSKIFVFNAGAVSYAFGVNEQNTLEHIYWGDHVRDDDFAAARSVHEWSSFELETTMTPLQYPAWGAGLYVELSLKVTFADGNRDLVLKYVGHQIRGNTLTVTLKDIQKELFVELHYTVHRPAGLIRREAVVENRTAQPVVVENARREQNSDSEHGSVWFSTLGWKRSRTA